jgi:hypothetical protein
VSAGQPARLSWGQALRLAYIATLGGLIVGTVMTSLGIMLLGGLGDPVVEPFLSYLMRMTLWLSLAALLLGALPALLLGAPLYALLIVRNLAGYSTSAALGIAISWPLLQLLSDGLRIEPPHLYGPSVACFTHFLATRLRRRAWWRR